MCVDEKKCVLVSVKFPRRARRATNSFKSNDEQCYQEWRHPVIFNNYSWLVRRSCGVASRFGRVGKLGALLLLLALAFLKVSYAAICGILERCVVAEVVHCDSD